MHVEVSVALNFVISYLYSKLPRRRVDMFGEELEKGIKLKFQGHWYPDKPFKGSGFRSIRISEEKMDPVIAMAAHASGLDIDEVKEYLPEDLMVWVDPSEVSYRIGEKGPPRVLYSAKRDQEVVESVDKEVQSVSCMSRGFNPEAQSFKPIDSLSSSLSNLSLSPSPSGWGSSSSPTGSFNGSSPVQAPAAPGGRQASKQTFTAATFAQTKFGSTKLKSQAKRPSRLSPTELMSYMKQQHHHGPQSQQHRGSQPTPLPQQIQQQQQQQLQQTQPIQTTPWPAMQPIQHGFPAGAPQRPRSLHPREASRQEIMEHHQRLLFLQQQQQQQQLQLLQTSAALLSPLGGFLGDLQLPQTSNNTGLHLKADLLSPGGSSGAGSADSLSPESTPSPDEAGNPFLDSLKWGVTPSANLQQMLVANWGHEPTPIKSPDLTEFMNRPK